MIELTTGQVVAVFVSLFGTIGTLLGIIRSLYVDRIKDRDRTILGLEEQIKKYEREREETKVAQERYVQTLETAVEVARRQTDAIQSLVTTVGTTKKSPVSSRGGE